MKIKNFNNRNVLLLLLFVFIIPFLMNPVWTKNQITLIDFFIDISGQPLLIYFALPFVILFENFSLSANLTNNYGYYLLIRWGKFGEAFNQCLMKIVDFALIDGIVFLFASLFAGIVKNYSTNLQITDIVLSLGRFGQLILFILAYSFWLLLIQLLFKKVFLTFIGGLLYWGFLIFSFRTNLTLIREFPLIPGQDLNWGSLVSAVFPNFVPFISLCWIIVELFLIKLICRKKY